MLHGNRSTDEPLFINLTPMIDIILTLLIFFITATKLYDWDEQKLDVTVPQVSEAKPLTQLPDDLVLTLDQEGAMTLNGQAVDRAALRTKLLAARKNFAEQGVVIRADGRTRHQKVAEAMSSCQGAGIGRIVISVREIAKP